MNDSPDTATKAPGIRICLWVNTVLLALFALYYFVYPGVRVICDLFDPNVTGTGIPRFVWRLHRAITPGYEKWARERIRSRIAERLELHDVPSTEWPVFGSVFYLMATEKLQAEWEKNHALSKQAPKEYARRTIEAAKDVLLDPVHHWWVKEHWGNDYLHGENVFFRSLLIAGLTSYEKLTGNLENRALLVDQMRTLAADLDASKFGVLDDYPAECYPMDVLGAIGFIRYADQWVGMDQSAFIRRARRAFEGSMLDPRGLIPYEMDSKSAKPAPFIPPKGRVMGSPSRGMVNSYVLIFARDLWPDLNREWYRKYDEYFWQDRWWASGYREFPKDLPNLDWYYDVDSGPILDGFSPGANAYAYAAAKVNGRLDQVTTLGREAIATSWPLPNGRLLGARVLSSELHAPYLGEVNLLWLFSYTTPKDAQIRTGGRTTLWVYLMLTVYLGIGTGFLFGGYRRWRQWQDPAAQLRTPFATKQVTLWVLLMVAALIFFLLGRTGGGIIALMIGQLLPRCRRVGK
jgi:hypothetical protein